jgi:sugar transferase (PEP-CTERM/EpsH1 system associated)
MNILWLKMGGLWPLNTGGRQRTFHMVSELSRRHDVTVVTTAGPKDDPEELVARLPHCRQVTSVPFAASKQGSAAFLRDVLASWCSRYPVDLYRWRPPQVRQLVAKLTAASRPDVIVADFLCGAVNLPPTHGVPIVFFEHNVEYLIWKRLADVEPKRWRRALLELEWRKMRRCEIRACREADATIAVSEDDRHRLASAAGVKVSAIPTGVDTAYFAPVPRPEVPARLVFSGSMDWYPNEDAMLFWAESILPRVARQVPDVSLTIVGRNPSAKVRALADRPGIHVTGTVDDVRPHIADASLYVVPLRVGGGTRLKIFEALAMGKAVLSTTVGAEGLDVRPGTHVELADGADAFADAVISLLSNPSRRAALGRAGRALVEEQFSWPQVTRRFEALLADANVRPASPAGVRAEFRPRDVGPAEAGRY